MPEGVGEEIDVAGLAEQLRGAGRVGRHGAQALGRCFAAAGPAEVGVGGAFALVRYLAQVAAGEDGEIAAVLLLHVGEQEHRLHRQGRAGILQAHHAQGFAAVGVGVAGELRIGRAHDGLGHGEQDVRPHDVHDVVEHRRGVDQIHERLVVFEQVAAVHEAARVEIAGVRLPGIVADGQVLALARVRLPAGHGADAVHFGAEERHLLGVEHALQVQVAVGLPLPPFFRRERMHDGCLPRRCRAVQMP